jgi:hypothetical protein
MKFFRKTTERKVKIAGKRRETADRQKTEEMLLLERDSDMYKENKD